MSDAALRMPTADFTLPRSMRTRIEATIERLITLLDFADGDLDLEAVCEDEGAQCDDEGQPDNEDCEGEGLL